MKKHICIPVFFIQLICMLNAGAQVVPGISGNFEINSQYYEPDPAIEAPVVKEKLLNNGFLNLNYVNGNFRAGLRYEAYLNPILGFDPRYTGSGIPFRYAGYTYEGIDITVGNFYDQFGNGLIFRSYEERALGVDNAMDGIRVGYQPARGIYLKGLVGRQRDFFQLGPGLVRGADADVQFNEVFSGMKDSRVRVGAGASFVSKFQSDEDVVRILPENVAAFAGRANISSGKFALNAEYAYKYNDPSIGNGFIYKDGEALFMNLVYAKKGLGAAITAKRIDNMNFRSDRGATVNQLMINYLPAINKQHTYRLITLYPYATQPNGEMGVSGELYFTLKPESALGGAYGTSVAINGSAVSDIERSPASNDTIGYASDFFSLGETVYYHDASIEVTKKLSKKVKLIGSYVYQLYNKDIVEGKNEFGLITAHTAVAEITYKINTKHSLRTELQHLYTEQDKGSWAMALIEYGISPHWSFTLFDEYNYGNEDSGHRYHYYNASIAYTKSANRFSIGYVRQRAGLLCVGGVCRVVPASNGISLNITSRF